MPTLATRLEHVLGPLEFVFLRYAFALVGMLILWPWLPGKLPRGLDFWRTCLMGVTVFSLGHLCQVGGIQQSQASDASILLALDPLVSILAAALFLGETIPGRRWLGFALAVAGVALMSLGKGDARLPGLLANLLIVLSFVTEAVWSVMGKPLIGRWGIPKVTTLALAAGTAANVLLLWLVPSGRPLGYTQLPGGGWFALAFLGLVLTAFGYNAWFVVIREAPVSVASMTIYLQPVVGTLVAFGATGEQPHAGHLWGSLAIVAGLVVGIRRPKKTCCREPGRG
jgi:drug/metabolite transporter (DMT)-like permease